MPLAPCHIAATIAGALSSHATSARVLPHRSSLPSRRVRLHMLRMVLQTMRRTNAGVQLSSTTQRAHMSSYATLLSRYRLQQPHQTSARKVDSRRTNANQDARASARPIRITPSCPCVRTVRHGDHTHGHKYHQSCHQCITCRRAALPRAYSPLPRRPISRWMPPHPCRPPRRKHGSLMSSCHCAPAFNRLPNIDLRPRLRTPNAYPRNVNLDAGA